MRDQKAKADAGKTQPVLLQKDMAAALYLVQRVLDFGESKYDRKSWQNVELDRWDDAHRRHQQQLDLGELFDRESGLLHRAHQITGLIIMLQLEVENMLNNSVDPTKALEKLGKFKPAPQTHKQVAVDVTP